MTEPKRHVRNDMGGKRMARSKRPFNKLAGVPKETDDYAVKHDRRPFVFNMAFADGSTVSSSGTVDKKHCERLAEIFMELHTLTKEQA